MNENVKYVAAAVAVVGLSVGAVMYVSRSKKAPAPAEPVAAAPLPAAEPAAPPEPAIKHPVPETERPTPLPPLAESDAPVQKALGDLFGKAPVEQFVITENLVRHIVVTIDNLTEPKLAQRIRPVKSIPGMFAVSGTEDALELHADNYNRYVPLVQLVRTMDTPTLVATYTRYYPLFQEAYETLGHPPQYFNDRLVAVIDHLLQTPELEGPISLAQPGVLYEYADPKIESLSSGQKLMIRMGKDNATVVRQKLRELRGELVKQQAPNQQVPDPQAAEQPPAAP